MRVPGRPHPGSACAAAPELRARAGPRNIQRVCRASRADRSSDARHGPHRSGGRGHRDRRCRRPAIASPAPPRPSRPCTPDPTREPVRAPPQRRARASGSPNPPPQTAPRSQTPGRARARSCLQAAASLPAARRRHRRVPRVDSRAFRLEAAPSCRPRSPAAGPEPAPAATTRSPETPLRRARPIPPQAPARRPRTRASRSCREGSVQPHGRASPTALVHASVDACGIAAGMGRWARLPAPIPARRGHRC